jgi:hypothetical protein
MHNPEELSSPSASLFQNEQALKTYKQAVASLQSTLKKSI